MRKADTSPPSPTSDADEWTLPGLELQHDLHFLTRTWQDWDQIACRLRDAKAEVHALTIGQQADGVSIRCRIKRVSPGLARALCASLRDDGVALWVKVEHLMLAK